MLITHTLRGPYAHHALMLITHMPAREPACALGLRQQGPGPFGTEIVRLRRCPGRARRRAGAQAAAPLSAGTARVLVLRARAARHALSACKPTGAPALVGTAARPQRPPRASE